MRRRAALVYSALLAGALLASVQFAVNGALYAAVGLVPAAALFILYASVGVLHGADRALPVPMLLLVAGSTLFASVLASVLTVNTFPSMPSRLYSLWLVDVAAYSMAYLAGWMLGMHFLEIRFEEKKPEEKAFEAAPPAGPKAARALLFGNEEKREPLF